MTGREFDIWFRRLYLPLGMYALRLIGDADASEDVVEDAFMKAWQAVDGGKEIDNFKAYMYRNVRNGCISLLRNRKVSVPLHDLTDIRNLNDNSTLIDNAISHDNSNFSQSAIEIPDPDESDIDTSVRDASIWKAIDSLPQRCREVFLLSKRDGLSNEEIAEELGISIKTVKNQMTKAFSRLRDALSNGHKPFFLPFL